MTKSLAVTPSPTLTGTPNRARYLQRDLTSEHVYRVLVKRPPPRTLALRGEEFRETAKARSRLAA